MTEPLTPTDDPTDTLSLHRRALDLTALRESILQAVLLRDQYRTIGAYATEAASHALDSAALDAADDMRDAFAAIGIDRETLAKLGDLL